MCFEMLQTIHLQGQIYNERCEQLIQRALEGNNVTIMAFGAVSNTGSFFHFSFSLYDDDDQTRIN